MVREQAPLGVRSISTQIGEKLSYPFSFMISNLSYRLLIYLLFLVSVDGFWYCIVFAVRNRMKSVKNIQKITKAMKMVAASKLRAIQTRAENSRGLWQPFTVLLGDSPSMCYSFELALFIFLSSVLWLSVLCFIVKMLLACQHVNGQSYQSCSSSLHASKVHYTGVHIFNCVISF